MTVLARDMVKVSKDTFAKACALEIAIELVTTIPGFVFVRANRFALREMTRNGLSFSYNLKGE